VTDIPGVFLHADMDDKAHMLLAGTITELIVKLDPKPNRKYNVIKMTMIYVQLKKAPYRQENLLCLLLVYLEKLPWVTKSRRLCCSNFAIF